MDGQFDDREVEFFVLIDELVGIEGGIGREIDSLECFEPKAFVTIVRVSDSETIEDIGDDFCSSQDDFSREGNVESFSSVDKS